MRLKDIRFTAGVFSWCERNGYLWALERRQPRERSQDRIVRGRSLLMTVRACAGNKGRGDERLA
jgi:hypothetical protein